MSRDLSPLYAAVEPALSAALVSAPAATSLGEIIAALPGGAETFGFELRLAGGDDRADLGVGMSIRSGAPAALAEPGRSPALARAVEADDRWRRLHHFGQLWAVEREWQVRVPFLFLELDFDAPRVPVPVPSVFLGLDWPTIELTAEARGPARAGRHDLAPGLASARGMLAVLRRDPLSAGLDALLARCFALLPDGALVLHLAVMLGRPGDAVRLSLLLPRGRVASYLTAIGWHEGQPELERIFRLLAPAADLGATSAQVQIDLDLGENFARAAGVMLRPKPAAGWAGLFDALVAAHLCDASRRDAILAWPGATTGRAPERRAGPTLLERYIAHAKVTCGTGLAPQAKAYIGVRWA